jgi:hypothetical protein
MVPKQIKTAGHVECVRDIRNVYKILIDKREGDKPPLYKWKDYLQKPIAAQLLKKFPAFSGTGSCNIVFTCAFRRTLS